MVVDFTFIFTLFGSPRNVFVEFDVSVTDLLEC